VFCAACGLFQDPFYSWKKTDIHTITIPANTRIWIPLVIRASLKDSPSKTWVLPEHQVVDADPKWGGILYGYLARYVCDVDRNWILHKKIYDAVIKGESDDLISMSLELQLARDLNVIIDITDLKISAARAKGQYDGVLTRTNFLEKTAAAIHIFNPSVFPVGKHAMNDPVSPKKVVEDQAFMNKLKTAW
jgi:hypothetical protein